MGWRAPEVRNRPQRSIEGQRGRRGDLTSEVNCFEAMAKIEREWESQC